MKKSVKALIILFTLFGVLIFAPPAVVYAQSNYDYVNDTTPLYFPDINVDISQNKLREDGSIKFISGENNTLIDACKKNVSAKNFKWTIFHEVYRIKYELGVPVTVRLTQGMVDEYCRRNNLIVLPDYVFDVPAEISKASSGSPEGDLRESLQKKQVIEYVQNVVKNNKTSSSVSSANTDALKTASVNNAEFNAYTYYSSYPDLQAAIGADAQKLYEHWSNYGKAEGRKAK